MRRRTAISIVAGVALALSATAHADAAPMNTPAAGQPSTPAQAAVNGAEPAALSDEALGQLRGGESMVVTNQTLVAITSGNVINGNYAAGNVSISDSALSNFNGLGNLLINTGAQVSLQTGMNVTINVNQ